tara:strand:- start:128 stop:631 length:504 start_codon:yes stop_codon:yes gene_type:complete
MNENALRLVIRKLITERTDWAKSPYDWKIKTLTVEDLQYWADVLDIKEDHPLNPKTAETYYVTSNYYCPVAHDVLDYEQLNLKVSAQRYNMYQMDNKIARSRIGLYLAVSDWVYPYPEGQWHAQIYVDAAYGGGTVALDDGDNIRSPANRKAFKDLFDNWLKYAKGT